MQKMNWFPKDEHEQCFKTSEQILGALSHPKLIGGSCLQYMFWGKFINHSNELSVLVC